MLKCSTTPCESTLATGGYAIKDDCCVKSDRQEMPFRDKGIIRNVQIIEYNYGYSLLVGCQTIAIESKDKLIALLTAYINDPKGTEEKYNNGTLFN